MTVKDRHRKAQIIKKSWGKKCDKILVMSTLADKSVPTIALKREEDDLYNDLWNRDMEAFRYVYLNHKNEADWFIKTDDETYVIMENLKYMLKSYSSSEAVYFRCMQARQVLLFQAGYVFSKEALKIFAKRAHECNVTDSNNILIGKCLQYLNITKLDSRDSEGRDRMFPYSPPFLGLSSGASDYAISFHNVTDIFTFLLEYFVYHLKPFGIVANYQVPDRDE